MAKTLLERLREYGGLLNTPIGQSQGGLLNNIPQGALLGSSIFSQGIQGKDPFSALLPAVAQTAQIQKYMTPTTTKPSFETFVSKDGKDQVTVNTSTKSGLNKATDLTNQGYTKFSKAVQAGDISSLQKSTQTQTEKDIRSGVNLLEDLNLINASFDEEFLTAKGKVQYEFLKKKDLLVPGSLKPEEKQYLASYGVWDANSNQYFNRYRKEITGVAAGAKEIGYLKSSIPSDEDTPAVYGAKMKNQIKIQERLNNAASDFLKLGSGVVYKTNPDGSRQYSQEFLNHVKENKIPPTGEEVENILRAYKKDRGYNFEQAKTFLDIEYKGIDWEDVLKKYIESK